MQDSLYWHDYETFGAVPAIDRPSQFAGLRTDFDLNVIGEPLVIYCQPQMDILPSPQACLITGITPQHALEHGLPEPEFIRQIHSELALPGTCGVGYNSIRFDDEVTRYSLYRNFFDPYQREWQNGNSRWDIIDLLRATRALRPDGIEWPDHEPGSPSFKLEHLTQINGISHEDAHDALSDVTATIAMAKLVKQAQPKLFDYVLQNRGKVAVAKIVDTQSRKPFFHCSGMLSKEHLYSAIMIPLAAHPTNKNAVICFDLSADPELLIKLDADEIKQRVFSRADDLPQGIERIPLKLVHLNKAPMVATPKVVDSTTAKRLSINLQRCEEHWQRLQQIDLQHKLQAVFVEPDFPAKNEAEQQLYGGFLPNRDKPLLDQVRTATLQDFKQQEFYFSDKRYNSLLFNYKARYFPQALTADEQSNWLHSCRERLTNPEAGYLTLNNLQSEIEQLLTESELPVKSREILAELEAWRQHAVKKFAIDAHKNSPLD
jgi:exodeoxyribonuclease-1